MGGCTILRPCWATRVIQTVILCGLSFQEGKAPMVMAETAVFFLVCLLILLGLWALGSRGFWRVALGDTVPVPLSVLCGGCQHQLTMAFWT